MKYTLIEEKGPYALILRGESMTQYAVVYGLDKETGSWDWTCCYYDFGELSELTKAEALFKVLDYQCQHEGIDIAKSLGKYTGRKPIDHPDFDSVVPHWRRGEITAVEAMRILNMSKTTFYRRVKVRLFADSSGSVLGK